MTASTSSLSFTDCYDVLDQAMISAKGIRVKFDSRETAWHFRTRLYYARARNRIDNAESYPSDHPLFGRSEYDSLQVRVRENGKGWEVLVEKLNSEMQIEEI